MPSVPSEFLSTYTTTCMILALHLVVEQLVLIAIVFITDTAVIVFLLFMIFESFLVHKVSLTSALVSLDRDGRPQQTHHDGGECV